ncbi:GNAT family N-acetyltransferase [Lysobacter tyrosinilyticus]
MERATDPWQQVPHLRGEHATLEPLRPEHAQGLRDALADGRLWELWYTSVPEPEAVDAYIAGALAAQTSGECLVFVVRAAGGEIVGTTRYYQLDRRVPRLAIGYTWYATKVHRSGLNTQAKLLLLEHAFETLGCEAVAFETSWFNQTSRAAIARLGAKQDGVLRNHMRHRDGTLRDTVVFSITAGEWPTVKRHLQGKLQRHG